jgi:hypothetical protein
MKPDEQVLIWGAIAYAVVMTIAFGLAYLLFWCWKSRIAVTARWQFSRDSQPIRYWTLMLFYVSALLLIVTMLGIRGKEWKGLLVKVLEDSTEGGQRP